VLCVPCWNRGDEESCVIDILPNAESFPQPFPLTRRIRVLANGLSVGTPNEGVKGKLVIISTWEELVQRKEEIQGSIVLFDYKFFESYGSHNSFRNTGALKAAAYGAVGVLIRSLAPNTSTSGE
jgi:carboxypeptidase Q